MNADTLHNLSLAGRGPFLGRKNEMNALFRALQASSHVALHGSASGGMGRRRLAEEFARRTPDTYSLIWWLDARSQFLLDRSLSNVASALNLPADEETSLVERRKDALAWLREQDDWLLIIEGASADTCRRFINNGYDGHRLFLLHLDDRHGVIAAETGQ